MSVSHASLIAAGSKFVESCNKTFSGICSSALLMLIGAYRTIGTTHFGGQCRFEPSCSEYAAQAVRTHQPGHALKLIFSRLLKCRPGGPFGIDPVPEAESCKMEEKRIQQAEFMIISG